MAQKELSLAQSSMIASATYDEETGQLLATFNNSGAVYGLSADPGEVLSFSQDTSPGKFWNANFRGRASRVS